MHDNDNISDKQFLIKSIIHHAIIVAFVVIVVFAIGYGYMATMLRANNKAEMPISKNEKGTAKPLPNFIIDKLKPDELGQLKP